MAQITWQNVNGPSLAEASRPLDSAARAFDMGFGALRGVLDQRNQIDNQNFQTGKANNTAAYLDKIAQLRTIDQLKQAQSSGALDQLRASFGSQIDANAVRGAADTRLTGLMAQEKQSMEFDNLLKDQRSHPFMDAYKVAAQKGDKIAMAAAEQSYNQAGGRDLASLVTYADNTGWQKEQRGEERTDWGRKAQDQVLQTQMQSAQIGNMAHSQRMAEGQLANSRANTAISRSRLGFDERGMKLREAEAMASQAERLENRMAKLREERGETMAGRAGSVKGIDLINKQIASLEDPDDRAVARAAFNKALKANPDATTESVLQATLGVRTAWDNTDEGQRQQFVDTVKESMASGAGSEDQVAAERRRAAIDARIAATQEQLDKFGVPSAATKPVPSIPVVIPSPFENPAQVVVSAPKPYSSERASFNQAQEQRQAIARERTAANKAEFKAEERKLAMRSLQVFENQIKALNKSDPSRNRDITLERAKNERDRLKQLLGK